MKRVRRHIEHVSNWYQHSHVLCRSGIKPSRCYAYQLNRFLVITFANFTTSKYYCLYYWSALPAFVSKPTWEIREEGLPLPYFLVRKDTSGAVSLSPVEAFDSFFVSTSASDVFYAVRIVGQDFLPRSQGIVTRGPLCSNLFTLWNQETTPSTFYTDYYGMGTVSSY
jgi:hypothetical protein